MKNYISVSVAKWLKLDNIGRKAAVSIYNYKMENNYECLHVKVK